ncbi:MAG: NADH-quinone oxidoreductase subunit J [Anaerolineae bacterium]
MMLETYLFLFFGGVAVVAALAMVFSRNAVHSALFLLLNLCMVAAIYVLLNAQFIAAVQIVVYAGAIVVLVLFVIMLLGAELGEKIPSWLTPRNAAAVFLALALLTITGTAVFEWLSLPQAVTGPVTDAVVAQQGSVQLVGLALFTQYLLPFELTSVLLLVGIVGVVVLGGWRKVQHRERGE